MMPAGLLSGGTAAAKNGICLLCINANSGVFKKANWHKGYVGELFNRVNIPPQKMQKLLVNGIMVSLKAKKLQRQRFKFCRL